MSETLVPLVDEEWKKPPQDAGPSIMTPLGLAAGDVLVHLEAYGVTPLRVLIRALPHPAPIVTMAVGALIRQGLVRGVRHELELIVEQVEEASLIRGETPEVWGG